VIAPCARQAVGECQLLGIGINNRKRLQQSLCIAVQRYNLLPPAFHQDAFQRLRFALHPVDGPCLFPVFVHCQHHAAIQ
jgi:hypothetical protein